MPEYDELDHLPAEEVLAWGLRTFRDRFAISTSFQKAGMVVIDIAARISSNVRVITLDTGRLPDETYEMMEIVRERYGVQIEVVMPDPLEVQAMVRQHGVNLFQREQPQRMLCCHIRKVKPLERKLRDFRAYAVGLRRLTSDARNEIRKVEPKQGTIKISPIADWTKLDIDDYTLKNDIPIHPLYAKGYTSIGCAPCTRPTEAGESDRAGRWWWEEVLAKECGLHVTANGKIGRRLDVLIEEVSKTANGYGFDGSGI